MMDEIFQIGKPHIMRSSFESTSFGGKGSIRMMKRDGSSVHVDMGSAQD